MDPLQTTDYLPAHTTYAIPPPSYHPAFQIIEAKRKIDFDANYPSPVQEKRFRLEELQTFDLQSPIPGFTFCSQPEVYQAPLSPPSPYVPSLKPVKLAPAVAQVQRPILVAKKPSAKPKDIPLPLPYLIQSDNGKKSWELLKSLGKGGCGEVYLSKELDSDAGFVAIKIIKDRKQFLSELHTMKTLNDHQYGRGYTPKLITSIKKKKALVMEYLSETLAAKFDKHGFHFSLKTICMLALNMMTLVRDFNTKTGQIHVDIKPSNFCTSPNGRDLYLIDFGYSTSAMVKLPGQTGTPLFMAQQLQTIGATYPALQDDYESIGYVLMFLISGGKKGLPWGTLRTHKDLAAAKSDLAIKNFCQSLCNTEYEPLAQTLANHLFCCRDRHSSFSANDFCNMYADWEGVLHRCGMIDDRNYDWVDQELFNSSLTLMNSSEIGVHKYI